MNRTRIQPALVAAALVVLMSTSLASGTSHTGHTTSTGDVDHHGSLGLGGCLQAFTNWEIVLTLEEPAATDVVGLTVQGRWILIAGANVATGATNAQAIAYASTADTCRPLTQVTGLQVEGELPYTLEFRSGP